MNQSLDKKVNNDPLKIVFVCNEQTNKNEIEELFKIAKIYLNISWIFIDVQEIKDIENIETPDILFIDYKENFEKIFNWEQYHYFHQKNSIFMQVTVLDSFQEQDYKILKFGTDDIIYKNFGYDFLKWKIIAILRRMWDSHSNKTTKIYKGMIIDNLKNVFYFNDKLIYLTKKEFELMDFLMTNIKQGFISKKKIFEALWGVKGNDCSRVTDQIIFKIKKKIGKDVFQITKQGIKIL
ncbi:MAG: response regulator transcription factor [Mycoplasmataceae bacterium]|nr:response regulator transcription factor [Mycoplasmataceae bacterium]